MKIWSISIQSGWSYFDSFLFWLQLSAEINQSVNEIKQAVINLRDTIVNLQFNSSNQKSKLTICCSYNDPTQAGRLSYDVRFRQLVSSYKYFRNLKPKNIEK